MKHRTAGAIAVLLALCLMQCGGTGNQSITEAASSPAAQFTFSIDFVQGEVQTPFSATLQPTGGKPPYSWKLTSGNLPGGLKLDAQQGTITGTPTAIGDFAVSIQIQDSSQPSPRTVLRGFSLSIVPSVQVVTTELYASYIQQPYQATLSAMDGVGPYAWSVVSGNLPKGLTLDSKSGKVTGTTTEAGEFKVTVQARDSLQPAGAVATKTFDLSIANLRLDKYGGLADAPVAGGATGYFRVAKVGNRWELVTPAGNAFFMLGVYNISGDTHKDELGGTYDSRAITKYGDRDINWGPQQVRRLRSWGFNSVGPYSIRWVLPTASIDNWPGDHTQPEKVPMVGLVNPSLYSLRNLNNWASGPVKDIVYGTDSHFTGYRSTFPDVFDPNFEQFLDNQLKDVVGSDGSGNSPWLIGWMVDDTDYLNGFGAGPDFTTIPEAGNNNRHLGWIALVTAPTQASNSVQKVSYKDAKVYTKYALQDFLEKRYGTIAALNAAWGSNYSTFDSDGGWPTGKGLLDEDGRHTGWVGTDPVNLSDANPTLKKDLDDFLYVLASRYFQVCRDRVKANSPNTLYFGPTVVGSWGTPARRQVLQAAGQYVDVLNTNLDVTDQARLDFVAQYLGDKPLAFWEGRKANPDSALWRYSCSGCSQTQAERGQYYQNRVAAYLQAVATPTGAKPSVGFIWWEFHDNYGEKADWGLVSLEDNAYNGKEDVVAGGKPGVPGSARCKDAWGYSCGAEERDYGDFLSSVWDTNINALKSLLPAPPGP